MPAQCCRELTAPAPNLERAQVSGDIGSQIPPGSYSAACELHAHLSLAEYGSCSFLYHPHLARSCGLLWRTGSVVFLGCSFVQAAALSMIGSILSSFLPISRFATSTS